MSAPKMVRRGYVHDRNSMCASMGCIKVRPNQEWRATFGPQLRWRAHTRIGQIANHEGWVAIFAPDEDTATMMASALLGDDYDQLRHVDDPPTHPTGPDGWEETYPGGELLRVEIPFTQVKEES